MSENIKDRESIKIYVVYGSCGEYSAHIEWPVKAFYDELEAQASVIKLTEAGNTILSVSRTEFHSNYAIEEVKEKYPKLFLDPNFDCVDYGGFNYAYWAILI